MSDITQRYRHEKERRYGGIMLVVGCLIWGLAALLLIGSIVASPERGLAFLGVIVFYALVIGAAVAISHAFLRAYMIGNYVMVSEQQFPALHAMVAKGAAELGLATAPIAFVYNASGVMNAMALRLFGRRFVWLTAALIDHDTEAQVRFVVGHELAHHAFGHLDRFRNFLKAPGYVVPFLGPAYLRSRELSCDRLGAFYAKDLPSSLGALQMLASGSARLNASMNPQAFLAQERIVPPIAGFLLHIISPYPRLTARVAAVAAFFGGEASLAR